MSYPTKKRKPRKSASFSGRPLVMENIAEESEGHRDNRRTAEPLENVDFLSDMLAKELGALPRSRPHKSLGGSSYRTDSSINGANSWSGELDENENKTRINDEFLTNSYRTREEQEGDMSAPLFPYSPVSVTSSSRRILGRKRSDCRNYGELPHGALEGERPEGEATLAPPATTPGNTAPIKRISSSLFYFQYEPEVEIGSSLDTGRRRIPRKDIPTSRKFSAASNYSFYDEDEDEKEEDETTEEDEDWQKTSTEDRGSKVNEEERILSDRQTLVETTSELYQRTLQEIDATTKVFRLSDDIYRQVKVLLEEEMIKGLRKDGNRLSTVKMYPTYVRNLPTGTESGSFLALDLGGTNFRVLLVNLKGHDSPEVRCKLHLIPTSILTGTGTALFDHIANCISEFLDEVGLKDQLNRDSNPPLPLGFTFSFPCNQDGLASARLVRWTKGFKCSGVEREDVARLLKEALARKGDLNVDCVAIINDNVGVLMSVAHTDCHCRLGVILGTGTNCCYLEKLSEVELWNGDTGDPKQVVINTEWGAFGDNGVLDFLRNPFDYQLDRQSLNPGHQLFEKMISGMYMGELVRLLLCELTAKGLLFGGRGSEELSERGRFYTKYISEIESDDPLGPLTNTRLVLEELNIDRYTRDDCRYVQHICWQVSQRAAFLAGTAVAAVIERVNLDQVTVAVDGSLYRFHPHFKDLMHKRISQLLKPNRKFKLVLASDGSGKGAALVAAVASSNCLSNSTSLEVQNSVNS